MYKVDTILTTIATTDSLTEAMAIANTVKSTYVEVKEIITENPYYAKSIKIIMK